MWELDHKDGRALDNWCFQTMVLEKTLESLLDSKEIKSVNIKGNQPWILNGRTDAEAEVPIFWPSDTNSWLLGKDPDNRKEWRQKEKWWQRMRWLNSITYSMNMNLGKLQEMVRNREACRTTVHGVAKSQTRLGNWTATTNAREYYLAIKNNEIQIHDIVWMNHKNSVLSERSGYKETNILLVWST